MDLITSLSSQVMHKALDGLAMRHTAISSNLANVDTPNYHRRDVEFEQALASVIETHSEESGYSTVGNSRPLQMKASHQSHFHKTPSLDEISPKITELNDLSFRQDGNSVDVESEMAQLARNTQRYLAISNLESRSLKSLRSVIQGG